MRCTFFDMSNFSTKSLFRNSTSGSSTLRTSKDESSTRSLSSLPSATISSFPSKTAAFAGAKISPFLINPSERSSVSPATAGSRVVVDDGIFVIGALESFATDDFERFDALFFFSSKEEEDEDDKDARVSFSTKPSILNEGTFVSSARLLFVLDASTATSVLPATGTT